MGCVIGLIIGCAHDRVIMSDLLIELSCMQDWPGAQETVQEILKGDALAMRLINGIVSCKE